MARPWTELPGIPPPGSIQSLQLDGRSIYALVRSQFVSAAAVFDVGYGSWAELPLPPAGYLCGQIGAHDGKVLLFIDCTTASTASIA